MKYKFFFISIIVSFFSLIINIDYFNSFENIFYDSFFKKKYYGKSREGSLDNIVVVDIDNRAVNKLGRFQNWERYYYAKFLEILHNKGANTIAFDLLLSESKNRDEDKIFAESIKNNGSVILGYNFDITDTSNFIYSDSLNKGFIVNQSFKNKKFKVENKEILDLGSYELHNNAYGSGHLNMIHSNDGVIRNTSLFFEYQKKLYPSLSFLAIIKYFNVYKSDIIFENGLKIELKNAEKPIKKDIVIDNTGLNSNFYTNFYSIFFDKKNTKNSILKFSNIEINTDSNELLIPFVNENHITEKKYKNNKYLSIVNKNDEVELLITKNYKRDNLREKYIINFKELEIRNHRISKDSKNNIFTIKNVKIGKIIKNISIPLNEKNEMIINYKGTWKTFKTVSFYDVIKNRVGKKLLKDKIILLGASLRGLMDLRAIPIQERFPGVEIHANIINTIYNEDFIKIIDSEKNLIILILFIIITCLLFMSNIHTILLFLMIFTISLSYSFFAYYLFDKYNILLNVFRPLVVILFSTIITYVLKYLNEVKNKMFIKNTLGKYVPEVVSEAVLKDSKLLKVGGERKYITMMFTDIRSFTSISEQLDSQVLIKFLNNYLMEMTKIIKENEGTLDKFIGDCIVCFYGAPLTNNHPYNACLSALRMLERLDNIKPHFENELLQNIEVGFGINTGEVTVGNIGSDELFDYTAIGDNMNLASRLEGLNKYYGTKILISESTYNEIKNDFNTRLIDVVMVKGKNRGVKIYELLSIISHDISSNNKKIIDYYNKAFENYELGDFKEAIYYLELILNIENDGPSHLLKERCLFLNEKGNLDDWDGIWKMENK